MAGQMHFEITSQLVAVVVVVKISMTMLSTVSVNLLMLI